MTDNQKVGLLDGVRRTAVSMEIGGLAVGKKRPQPDPPPGQFLKR